jgi:hypothetical protein
VGGSVISLGGWGLFLVGGAEGRDIESYMVCAFVL